MKAYLYRHKVGYTVIELIVTMAIVAALAATVGVYFVKLLTLHENEREDAYVREKLTDICGAYADFMSVGTAFCTSNETVVVKCRQETGGVSMETGVVSRVVYLDSAINPYQHNMDFNFYGFEKGSVSRRLSRAVNGDAALLPIVGGIVKCSITPLNAQKSELERAGVLSGYQTSDASLGYLEVSARYEIEEDGKFIAKTATVGRVVRMWNWDQDKWK